MTAASVLSRLRSPFRRGEVEDLRGLVIDEALELQDVELPNVDFTGAVFNAPLAIRGATFRGLAWFDQAVFNDSVDFSSSVFFNDGRFRNVKFKGSAAFSRAEFRGVACFDSAEFFAAAYLDRMLCYANLSLDKACFAGVASLQDTQCFGGLWGNRTRFRSRMVANGLEVHGRTWLVGATFGKESSSSWTSLGYRWS
jgi:uncharacterized protein YjbI with pentapeptide repeats